MNTYTQQSNNLSFMVINNPEQFKYLKSGWNELLRKTAVRAVTQTWEWMYTWWEIYGNERELCIFVVYENNEIIGIAPFSVSRKPTRHFKLLRYKTMWFLGSGKVTGRNVTSEYLDLIICKGKEEAFVDALLEWMSHYSKWDEIIIDNISSESSIPDLLKLSAIRHSLNFQIRNRAPSILIHLPDSWEKYLKSIGSNLRYKIKRGRKEFEKLGGTYYLVKEQSKLSSAFHDLETLHQHRWENKGEPGAFSDPKWKAFHEKFIALAFKNKWLKLSFLQLNKKPIAANYSFVFDKKVHFFQSGMIANRNKHIRPGLLLHSYSIEEAIGEGNMEYDFLKVGRLDSGYKAMWGNYSRDLLELRISKCSNRENIYRLLTRISDFARKAKHVFETKISHHLT